MKIKYATSTAMIGPFRVVKGSYWPASDRLVQENPGLFSDDPIDGQLSTSHPIQDEAPVEQVTAGPGERRSAVKRG